MFRRTIKLGCLQNAARDAAAPLPPFHNPNYPQTELEAHIGFYPEACKSNSSNFDNIRNDFFPLFDNIFSIYIEKILL